MAVNAQVVQMNPNQFLDFSTSKVQSITMEQLRRTVKENYPYMDETGVYKPISGIYHFDFFDRITDTCRELGYEPEYYDMFAAQNRDGRTPGVTLLPAEEARLGTRAVEAHILRRVFANIRIRDFDTDEYTTNLSIAFHQRGIQAGFGNNVKICHNQCMLSPDKYAATYKDGDVNKAEITEMLELIKGWLMNAKQTVEHDRERIAKMKSITVKPDTTFRLIGMLTAARVAKDSKNKDIHTNESYPLNQSQISDYTENLLIRYKANNKVTVWDLYNAATELYKATSLDMPMIMPMNRRMVEFLSNEFSF